MFPAHLGFVSGMQLPFHRESKELEIFLIDEDHPGLVQKERLTVYSKEKTAVNSVNKTQNHIQSNKVLCLLGNFKALSAK